MSTSILPILYLIYKIACHIDLKSRRCVVGVTLIGLLYLPSQLANIGAIFDFHNGHKKQISEQAAAGIELAELPDILTNYTRNSSPQR